MIKLIKRLKELFHNYVINRGEGGGGVSGWMTVKYLGGVCFSIMYSIKKKNILAKTKFLSRGRVLDHDYVTSMGVGLLMTTGHKGGGCVTKGA